MHETGDKPSFAWQPFTPRGVAAFAEASFGRLLLVQFIAAALVVGCVVWFVETEWFSVINTAIDALPSSGEIHSGTLNWRGDSPQILAENRFLAVTVDLAHEGHARSPAHIQVEFGQRDVRVFTLFGSWQKPYPAHWIVAFNRSELKPWWGAWVPALLAAVAGLVIIGLLLSWAGLASVYFLGAWLIAFFKNRALTAGGSWKLAAAALLPGAFFMLGAMCLYGFGLLDPIQFIALFCSHFLIGWAYLVFSTLSAPPLFQHTSLKNNPFVAAQGQSLQSEKAPHLPPKCESK